MTKPKLPSCLFERSTADAFKRILTHYCPPPKIVLDCTAGFRRMWSKIAYTSFYDASVQRTLTDKYGYLVAFLDIRPEVKPTHVGDFIELTKHIKEKEYYDVLVFDPPWVITGGTVNQDKWKTQEFSPGGGTYRFFDFYAIDGNLNPKVFDKVNDEFYEVLKHKGKIIMKIGDIQNCFYHIEAVKRLHSFRLLDCIVCPWGQPVGAGRRNHYYFLVFQKP